MYLQVFPELLEQWMCLILIQQFYLHTQLVFIKIILHDDIRTILVSEPEPEIEENQIEDVEMEKENKLQLLFYKNFKSFLKVLIDYYFLCMVKRIC